MTGHPATARERPADHPFDADTRVEPLAEDLFAATLSDRWNVRGGVINGGYYVAVCLRALRATLPHPQPLVVSTFFLRGGAPGAAEVRTEVGRRGRRVSTGDARMYQGGRELVRTTATFTELGHSQGPTSVLAAKPDLPAPEAATDPVADAGMPEVTMTDHVEYRFPRPPGWRDGKPTGDPSMEFWMRFTGGRDADPLSLPLLVDGAAPAILELGLAGSTTLELTTHVRGFPAPGWLACRATTRYLIGGYHEEDFEIWDSRGNLVAQARQLALALPG